MRATIELNFTAEGKRSLYIFATDMATARRYAGKMIVDNTAIVLPALLKVLKFGDTADESISARVSGNELVVTIYLRRRDEEGRHYVIFSAHLEEKNECPRSYSILSDAQHLLVTYARYCCPCWQGSDHI